MQDMGALPKRTFLVTFPLLAALVACQGKVEGSGTDEHVGAANGGSGSLGSGGSVALPPDTTPAALLPTRIRRLTNAEFENSVHDVVGNAQPVASEFVPDSRQSGFTVNDAQRVDSVLVKQIAGAATTLAAQVRSNWQTVAPCADPATQAETCAKAFIQSFASRAFRRPLADDEAAKLLVLYHVGADGAAYEDGIEEVASGVLQSAGFLYLTETGNAAKGSTIALTPYEIASQMSYLLTAGPPSQALLASAANGDLDTPAGRATAINQFGLLQGASALERVTRIIREWLGTDQLENTAKDTTAYPDFAALKPAMVAETTAFINDIVSPLPGGVPVPSDKGTLHQLLSADWTSTTDPKLLALYDNTGEKNPQGFFTLPARRGILNQGAFLSVYAHASETAPVLRGVALLRRITCIGVPSPATLNITVVPLVPDPSKTMRTRLNAHVTDPVCAGCHTAIDNYGFPFEIYDGMGKHQTQDQNQPIDSGADISTSFADLNGHFKDSNQLAQSLAESATVRECFARNIFRASSGRSDSAVQMSEDDFVKFWNTQASAANGNIIDTILAFIASPTFTIRRTQ